MYFCPRIYTWVGVCGLVLCFSARADFLRAVPVPGGEQLQVKWAHYQRTSEPHTEVDLVAMVHVGEKAFYERCAELLSSSDIELFEGVAPIGFYGPPAIDDPDFTSPDMRARLTKLRLYSLKKLAQDYAKRVGSWPNSMEQLLLLPDGSNRYALSPGEARDGWGNPFRISADTLTGQIHFSSLGADGLQAGTGSVRDLPGEEAVGPLPDSDDLMTALGAAYDQLAAQAKLSKQPSSLNFLGRKSVRADVSSDLIFGNPSNPLKTMKYWSWREVLPGILLTLMSTPLPQHFAIVYGAGHADNQERYLLEGGFRKLSEEWVPLFSATSDMPADILEARKQLIRKILGDR